VRTYTVAENDSFWSIAEKAYGDGTYYRALFAYNSDRYPHAEDVRVGSVLDMPSVDVLKSRFPQLVGSANDAVRTASNVQMPTAGGSATARGNVTAGGRTYVVQEGDTLFEIARRQLGKASYWQDIFSLNRAVLGENLDQLRPGTELVLPDVR
jgi:nucleoid-associated protein YgaU